MMQQAEFRHQSLGGLVNVFVEGPHVARNNAWVTRQACEGVHERDQRLQAPA